MGVHGHGNANGAQDHGDQANERKDSGGTVETVRDSRIPFLVIHDLRIRERCFNLFADGLRRNTRRQRVRQLEQQALAGAAARREQARGLQVGA